MNAPITWDTTDLSLDRCARYLGIDAIDLADAGFMRRCRCRAAGAWTANDREAYAVFRSILRAGGLAESPRGAHDRAPEATERAGEGSQLGAPRP